MFKNISKTFLCVVSVLAHNSEICAMHRLERIMGQLAITTPEVHMVKPKASAGDTYCRYDGHDDHEIKKPYATADADPSPKRLYVLEPSESHEKKDFAAKVALKVPIAPERDFSESVFTAHHMHILYQLLGSYSIAPDNNFVFRTDEELCGAPDVELEQKFVAIMRYQITRSQKLRKEICERAGEVLRDRRSDNPLSLELLTLLATCAPEYEETVSRAAVAKPGRLSGEANNTTVFVYVNNSITAAMNIHRDKSELVKSSCYKPCESHTADMLCRNCDPLKNLVRLRGLLMLETKL